VIILTGDFDEETPHPVETIRVVSILRWELDGVSFAKLTRVSQSSSSAEALSRSMLRLKRPVRSEVERGLYRTSHGCCASGGHRISINCASLQHPFSCTRSRARSTLLVTGTISITVDSIRYQIQLQIQQQLNRIEFPATCVSIRESLPQAGVLQYTTAVGRHFSGRDGRTTLFNIDGDACLFDA
jgi:hypothetical protein